MKKKIALVLVLALSLISVLALCVSADTCAHENTGVESVGAAGHGTTCYDCGEWFGETESHSLSYRQKDSSSHYLECGGCSYSVEESHEFDSGEYVDAGVQYTCVCGYQYIEHYHKYVYTPNGSVQHTVTCSLCDYSKQTFHNYGEPVYTPATDGTLASNTYTCEQCKYVDVRYINPSHTCDETNYYIKYFNESTHEYTCPTCDKQFKTESHQWDSGKVTQQPTPTENGVRVFTCTLCKGTKTETIDYIDFDKLLENMTQEEATDLYKKIFDKYQTALVKDGECMKPYVAEFVNVVLVDIHSLGSRSQYYSDFGGLYNTVVNLIGTTSFEYVKGFNDAMSGVIEENPVQGFFQGMWSGIAVFYSTIANGVTIGGIALGSIIATVFAILAVVWLLKAVKKS